MVLLVWETDKDGFLIPPVEESENNSTTGKELLPGQVTFHLHSRAYHDIELNDLPEKSKNLHIMGRYPIVPLKIIIHGWMANSTAEWVQTMTKAYLKHPRNLNVIVVNWGDLAGDIRYYPSSQSTESVGRRVSQFLDSIVGQGLARSNEIHIIGHSLGAHVAGVAGNIFSGTVGRITGLDPAKPGYELADSAEVLSNDDAEFVDVIHTAAGTSGEFHPRGHADFYPNGGANQPGCDGFSPKISSYLESISCSHMRVCDLFIESIIDYTAFITMKCPDNVSIPPKKEECVNSTKILMGENCKKRARGVYYLETNDGPPYFKKK
ncbi:endothelial lipase-like isoform X2 [Lycorma delicatula]|uniref:endothelial lipase-like isoform X2 n=1 Tax=Lycorma delicatula TaxID=130591 RepID=UPI003F5123CA